MTTESTSKSLVSDGTALGVAVAAIPYSVPGWIGVTHGLKKFRPNSSRPKGKVARISAARNEFEPYQIVIAGGGSGRVITAATPSALRNANGTEIPSTQIWVYREGLFHVSAPSSTEGDSGLWPDPLIPDIDPYVGERRNAFPMNIPAGEVRTIWVDVLVPMDQPAGLHTGGIDLTIDGAVIEVPVELWVRNFTLPSTSTLKSAFGIGWNDGCLAHHGSYEACGHDEGVEHYLTLYAKVALDHRITLDSVVYVGPHNPVFAERFDRLYGPLLDGTAGTRLEGAQLTTLRVNTRDVGNLEKWKEHLGAHEGWMERVYDYTCDEPPVGCTWEELADRVQVMRDAGIPTMVTTNLELLESHPEVGEVDILTPLVQQLIPRDQPRARLKYNLYKEDNRQLWWYQSCVSHGCGHGCEAQENEWYTGWPSYAIDASAVQHRTMEWLSFAHQVDTELYYNTTYSLSTAWEDQCAFGGAGDGTLFYPGTPDRIGGETDIPITSIRMKQIREGMEDFEYLTLLAQLGRRDLAVQFAKELFPNPTNSGAEQIAPLLSTRKKIAQRIEKLIASQTELQ